jgi:3-deoxy-7-phosphoheptulonate synthase
MRTVIYGFDPFSGGNRGDGGAGGHLALMSGFGVEGQDIPKPRMGADLVETRLPALADALRRAGRQILWCCDPMHGNTETTKDGIKTRRFEKVLDELEKSYRVLKDCGTHLGGVHFELTGDNVTECIGGAIGVTEADLSRDYRTTLNPRLNYEQAMEMALRLAGLMAQNKEGS